MSGDTKIPKSAGGPSSIPEVIREAQVRLPKGLWDIASGGGESEATLRRNRLEMEAVAFRPRILRGVAEPDLGRTVLGHDLASPVMLAPIGSIASFHPEGASAPAVVAGKRGTMCFVGTLAHPGLEEVAERAQGPLVFQVYVRGDRAWLGDLVQRAEGAGYVALCLTTDSTGVSRREREVHNRYRRKGSQQPNIPLNVKNSQSFQIGFRWEDFDWLRSITDMPIIVKGVMTAEDAVLAVQRGADAVYVSNHGGREMDHLPSTIEVLPEVVDAIGDSAEVLVDGGFVRGSDVVKALALGARAVLIGKLQVWGLAADGMEGLEKTLSLLDEEMEHTLSLLGVASVNDLGPEYVRPSRPTRLGSPEWAEYGYLQLPRL